MIIYKVYYRYRGSWILKREYRCEIGSHFGPGQYPGVRSQLKSVLDKYLSPPSEVDTPTNGS